jgi:hypothetical protein
MENSTGYIPKMMHINAKLEELSASIRDMSIPLAQATATYNTYKPAYIAAIEELDKARTNFQTLAGFPFSEIGIGDTETVANRNKKIRDSTTLSGYLEKIGTYTEQANTAKGKYEAAEQTKKNLTASLSTLEVQYENVLKLKNRLNKLFYGVFSRFIQEGTWIDESYLDDNLYYNSAKSVLYTSSMPKVTYSMSVLALARLPGYELYDFKIGD